MAKINPCHIGKDHSSTSKINRA